MKKILILGGGFSKERPISLVTAKSVLKALIKKNNLRVEFTDGVHSDFQVNDIIGEIHKDIEAFLGLPLPGKECMPYNIQILMI